MALSHAETKQLLRRLIFEDATAHEWIQDVWGLSPTLGEPAQRLVEILDELIDRTDEETLDTLLKDLYQDQFGA